MLGSNPVSMTISSVDVKAGLAGKLFLPDEGDALSAVIVLGGSGGGIREYEARLLAEHGFAALALRYFSGPGLPLRLRHIPLEYFERAIHWLTRQPRCAGPNVAIVGSSRGGEAALLLGATYPQVRAIVAFAPSCVVWGAAWTYEGVPFPFMSASLRHTARGRRRRRAPRLVRRPPAASPKSRPASAATRKSMRAGV